MQRGRPFDLRRDPALIRTISRLQFEPSHHGFYSSTSTCGARSNGRLPLACEIDIRPTEGGHQSVDERPGIASDSATITIAIRNRVP